MPKTNKNTLAEQKYEQLQKQVVEAVSEIYAIKGMANEIASRILLSISFDDVPNDKITQVIQTQLAKTTEDYFSELWMYCFRYALKLLKNDDFAKDIAQDAIVSLFKTDKQILYIKGWLKKTVFNQVQTKIKQLGKEQSLDDDNVREIAEDEPLDEDSLQKDLSPKDIKKYLNREDYKTYKKINDYSSLKAYAKAMDISYQTAREHKHMVIHNLRQNYLIAQGWKGTPQILSFRQISNLKRFLKMLISHAESNSIIRLRKYCSKNILLDATETLKSIREISDWSIVLIGDICFEVTISDFSGESPIFVRFEIKFSNSNAIRITDIRELNKFTVVDSDKLAMIPLDKGICTLSLDDIKLLIE